jgi:hypothetical protein
MELHDPPPLPDAGTVWSGVAVNDHDPAAAPGQSDGGEKARGTRADDDNAHGSLHFR